MEEALDAHLMVATEVLAPRKALLAAFGREVRIVNQLALSSVHLAGMITVQRISKILDTAGEYLPLAVTENMHHWRHAWVAVNIVLYSARRIKKG